MAVLSVSFTIRTLLLIILLQLIQHSSASDSIKRVPQGFVGMRGKKYFDYDDTSPYDKRRSQGFVGVKGKKEFLNNFAAPYDPYYTYNGPYSFLKRVPMGFMGMRGKKDDFEDYPRISGEYVPKRGSILGQIDYASNEDENLENDFSLLNELIQRYVLDNQARNQEEATKYNTDSESNDAKGINNSNMDDMSNEVDSSGNSELTKRAAQMNQFFGMRGKKADRGNYRGNKRPFDLSFRGKFVGVRGKKSVVPNDNVKESGLSGNSNDAWIKRKGPGSGFFGMRGKKWIDPDFSSEEGPKLN